MANFGGIPSQLQALAWKEFHSTVLGNLVNKTLGAFQKTGRTNSDAAVRTARRNVEQYARQTQTTAAKAFLKQLGPVGKLLTSILGVAGTKGSPVLANDLDVAKRFVELFSDQPQIIEWAKQLLETKGYRVVKPGEDVWPTEGRGAPPAGHSATTAKGKTRKRFDIEMSPGQTKRFPADHPIVTGQMINTPGSSNVHSYGYDIDSRVCYVRFRAQKAKSAKTRPTGPGSLYEYSNVPPNLFLKFYAKAQASSGEAVWDFFRIRGTISGHRVDYRLVGVTRGYVPRKATLTPLGETLIPREVRTTEGKVLRSNLPEEVVRPLVPAGFRGR